MDDVEQPRARVIASLPSSANPSSSAAAVDASAVAIFVSDGGGGRIFKSSKSREEGEVSSSSDADLVTSVSLPNNTSQHMPTASMDKPLQKVKAAVKVPTTGRQSTAGKQFGSSVLQNYRKDYPKHFKRKQMLLRSANNQSRHWYAKGAKNNLVISFSDDDSGSDSKEHIPEKNAKQISDLKHEPAPFSEKRCDNRATFSSIQRTYVPTSGFQEPSAVNGSLLPSQSSVVKTTNEELGQVQHSTMADQSLVVLCQKIAVRDDQLKAQNKLALQNEATIVSDSNQHYTRAMKSDNQEGLERNADETILRYGVDEPSKKRLKLEKSSSLPDYNMSSRPENWRNFHAKNSCSHLQSVQENLKKSAVLKNKKPFGVPSVAALHDRSLSEKVYVAKDESFERPSKMDERNNLPSNNIATMHFSSRNQLTTPKIYDGMSTEALYVKKSSDCGSENNEVDILERRSMHLQSLVKLEELLDKELEEAQDHRRLCELEERCSLKAYRKSQRALVAANEKCNLLYKKREQYSTKFNAFFLEASNSVWPSNWLRQESPQEDQLCDPDASTSAQQDNSALDGAAPHVNNHMSTDDEENFPSSSIIESKSADVNVDNRMEPSLDNSPDYELLEASLRSKLVARMGIRALPKLNDTHKGDNEVGKLVGGIAEDKDPSLLIKKTPSAEEKQTCSKGIHRPKESKGTLEFQPTTVAVFPFPQSDLHILCKHSILFFPDRKAEIFNTRENNHILTSKELGISDCRCDISVDLDPFWPLCMFEFRGKCNDEECPWQHMKSGMFTPESRFTCLQRRRSENAPRYSFAIRRTLSIPTYQVGPYLIKAEPYESRSVLAGSNWQYHLRNFCASFSSFPLPVRRVLPPDAVCLNTGDDHGRYCSWRRLSLSYHGQDGEISCEGSGDVEQLLEVALNQFDGKLCKQQRKKVLSLLARAIETYPSSVVLWVVYLYFYYIKEKVIGKDDMFLHAVQHNQGSYELWLLYINSRASCGDRAIAYDQALGVLCRSGARRSSPFILDIFLQMIDFLRMSGRVDEAVGRICRLLATQFAGPGDDDDDDDDDDEDAVLPDLRSCLAATDACLFWVSSVYFVVYEKLPGAVAKQFEVEKDLPFDLDWPSARVGPDREGIVLNFMNLAVSEMVETDESSFRALRFLAVSHVKCAAALQGARASADLLGKYLRSHPWCLELALMAVRAPENCALDFEELLSSWPEGTPGVQCVWNQYAEHALANGRIELAEELMARWYEDPRFKVAGNSYSAAGENTATTRDDSFGFLNLCFYFLLQKNASAAAVAVNRSLELASPEDYEHFVKENAAFAASAYSESRKQFPAESLCGLLSRCLADPRARIKLEPMSRSFVKTIRKPRVQQLVGALLGPVSANSSSVNSVLEACYGRSLLPAGVGDAADLVEALMEAAPTNYELALSACRVFAGSSGWDDPARFWACCVLMDSIFQAVPVPPEHVWLEAAEVLGGPESVEISVIFHDQAVSVYPFSVELWRSYARVGGDAKIAEAAQARGVNLL